MSFWYTSLEDQLSWERYCNLIKIVQPNPADWRALTTVNGLVPPGSEANTDSSNSPTEATQERKENHGKH